MPEMVADWTEYADVSGYREDESLAHGYGVAFEEPSHDFGNWKSHIGMYPRRRKGFWTYVFVSSGKSAASDLQGLRHQIVRVLSSAPSDGSPSVKPAPVLYNPSELRAIFDENLEAWTRDTLIVSSGTDIVTHPSYQRIIALGRQALPLVLKELEERPNHWFWALRYMAGVDPTEPGDTFDEAVQKWLDWGRSSGYLR